MLQLHLLRHPALHRPLLHVRPDLLAAAVIAAPLGTAVETPLVAMARDVAGAARVSILEPGPAHVGVLFVDSERDVRELARGFERYVEACGSGADDQDAERARRVQGLLVDGVGGRRGEVAVPFIFVRSGRRGVGELGLE